MNKHADLNHKFDRKTTQQLQEEIEELQLELLFREAEDNAFAHAPLEAGQHIFVEKWMQEHLLQKIAFLGESASKANSPKKTFPVFRIPTRAAAICAACLIFFLIGSGAGFAAANYLQRQAGAFVMTSEDENLIFRFQAAQEPLFVPAEWHGEYFPAYIPADFALTKVSSINQSFSRVCYENASRVSITFGEFGTDTVFGINSENAAVTRKEIGGRIATISETEDSTVVVLAEGDKMLIIEVTDVSFTGYKVREAAVKIAESILLLQ